MGGQGGQVWAHVLGHAGAVLLGGLGDIVSGVEIRNDIEQTTGRDRPIESLAELLGDFAGRDVGRILERVLAGDLPRDQAVNEIHDILCDDKCGP